MGKLDEKNLCVWYNYLYFWKSAFLLPGEGSENSSLCENVF